MLDSDFQWTVPTQRKNSSSSPRANSPATWRRVALIAAAATLLGATPPGDRPQRPPSSATRDFMRQKMEHSQKILEGLVTGNFQVIAQRSRRLSAMSEEGAWRAADFPEYTELSAAFRRHVETLRKAGESRDLDAASAAYGTVLQSCVQCHKAVRQRKNAAQALPNPSQESPLVAVAIKKSSNGPSPL